MDYILTVQNVMSKIKDNFPPTFKSLREGGFVRKSRTFMDSLLASEEKLNQVLGTLPSLCEFCDTLLENWSFKSVKSFLITMGHIKEISIKLKFCKTCKRAFYPDYYQHGILFVHNKFMISISAILDILNTLKQSGSLIESIKDKLLLLGQLEGLDPDDMQTDLSNNSIRIEKCVIGVASLIVTEDDINDVVCYLCGNCPKICCTDGNTKNSIHVGANMVFDYEDEGEIPSLPQFTGNLIEEVLCSAFFQFKTETKINMLKIPLLMPSCLMRKQINNERLKKTIMEKQFSYSDEIVEKFQDLVAKKELRINGIKDLHGKDLDELGVKLGIQHDKKSGEMLRHDLVNLSNIFLGGQVKLEIT